MTYTIVGVIGHIDHGKTTLVAALSGTDTDTHPEEKRSGITIDLGFASITEGDHQIGLIDAPGHQKYIGNLLAGVSGIDVGLLVVACDQGIQEQTLEHAAILQMLGVTNLMVALSRVDLVDDATVQNLDEELDVFLDDFGFRDVPKIPISAVTGTGMKALKSQLRRFAELGQPRTVGRYSRMPVDRVFSMPGRGCVIAGTVWSGSIRVGDQLQLADNNVPVRVREVEVHGESVDESKVGFRTALNVTGVSANEVQRGDELIQPDVFRKSHHLLMEVKTFRDAQEIKCPATLQLHIVATSCSARITGTRRLTPGQSAVVVVETEKPVVATFGQRCLFRLPYPVGTMGGGTILATLGEETRRTRKLIELGEKIAMADSTERLVAWAEFQGELDPTPEWCELQIGVPTEEQASTVEEALAAGLIKRLPKSSRLVATSAAERIQREIVALMTQQAEVAQDAWVVEEAIAHQLLGFGSAELIHWLIQLLVEDGRLVRLGNRIAIASDQNSLSKKQQARMEQILAIFDGNRSPPTLKDIADQLQIPVETATFLSRFAIQTNLLLEIDKGLLLSAGVFRELCNELQQEFAEQPELSVADIRDRWQVTRKHAIPFLEYCDQKKVTDRRGNVRTAGTALQDFTSQ